LQGNIRDLPRGAYAQIAVVRFHDRCIDEKGKEDIPNDGKRRKCEREASE
jgi:hypothetical protein